MRRAWEKSLMMAMVLALVVAPTLSYGAPARTKADELKVCAGKLEGVVVDSRGNVQESVAVKVVRDGKLFVEVKTDAKGGMSSRICLRARPTSLWRRSPR